MVESNKHGVIILESMITCLIMVLVWTLVAHCAVNFCTIGSQISRRSGALLLISSHIDRIRTGAEPLVSTHSNDNGIVIDVVCRECSHQQSLTLVSVTASYDDNVLVKISTAVLKR